MELAAGKGGKVRANRALHEPLALAAPPHHIPHFISLCATTYISNNAHGDSQTPSPRQEVTTGPSMQQWCPSSRFENGFM